MCGKCEKWEYSHVAKGTKWGTCLVVLPKSAFAKHNLIGENEGEDCQCFVERKALERRCGTCRHYEPNGLYHHCGYPSPEVPLLPASGRWSYSKKFMGNLAGQDCPTWEAKDGTAV